MSVGQGDIDKQGARSIERMDQIVRKCELKDGLVLAVAEVGERAQRVGHESEVRSLIQTSFFPAGLDGRLELAATRLKLPGVV